MQVKVHFNIYHFKYLQYFNVFANNYQCKFVLKKVHNALQKFFLIFNKASYLFSSLNLKQ